MAGHSSMNGAGGGPPRWSKEPPAAPGWYWWRPGAGHMPEVLDVQPDDDSLVVNVYEKLDPLPLSRYVGGEWCGPLEVPGE